MRIILLSILCWCFSSCGKNKCYPESFDYTYQTDKRLDTVSGFGGFAQSFATRISNGNKTVFRYTNQFKYCNNHSDNSSLTVQFEVPNTQTAFKLTDSASLRKANAVFSFWATGAENASFIKEGSIEGALSGDKWVIKCNVTAPLDARLIRFENVFKPI